ncbi:urea carboxylase-associated family protein [Mesorhizobium sp. M3A.F.Ca.ET.174.01.1.1]|nr:urea carboxylase-associated family protein [Mesorhizobium sp. M3A.F.Ca.ET.175.01.1.1]TGT28413.1 urea carboxylase-associated family protein [Mesorhizobium sp. M3A.F.Ca.ET.174.01.1.1]
MIPARRGIAFEVPRGSKLRIINTYGSQVLDTWAFAANDMKEYMSMEHTRSATSRIIPGVGDTYVSNLFTPMLTVIEDTSPGIHDTLMCCCSKKTYERLKHEGYHDNCNDNFHAALAAVGKQSSFTPGPLNLFMNFPVSAAGLITREPPVSRPGDFVLFDVKTDLLMVLSACPQDIQTVNGIGKMPTDAAYQILN